MNLGRKSESSEGLPTASPAKSKEPKMIYPQFDLRDKVSEAFGKEYDCDVGDTLTATVKLRVSGIRNDEYGQSKTFEVTEIDDVEVDGEEPEDEETKTLGYKRPSKSNAPDTTGADNLED